MLLAHDHLRFVDSKARIKDECPFAICRVTFDAVVWRPRVGMRLGAFPLLLQITTNLQAVRYIRRACVHTVGKLSLSSPDHISLLLHRTFNVSIPRHHIPVDEWVFEYGPAENDPEFGAGNAEGEGEGDEHGKSEGGSGRWVHKVTGTNLGGPSGNLEFTVVGSVVHLSDDDKIG